MSANSCDALKSSEMKVAAESAFSLCSHVNLVLNFKMELYVEMY